MTDLFIEAVVCDYGQDLSKMVSAVFAAGLAEHHASRGGCDADARGSTQVNLGSAADMRLAFSHVVRVPGALGRCAPTSATVPMMAASLLGGGHRELDGQVGARAHRRAYKPSRRVWRRMAKKPAT